MIAKMNVQNDVSVDEKSTKWNLHSLSGLSGFAFLWSWVLVLFTSDVLADFSSFDLRSVQLQYLVGLLGVVCPLLLAMLQSFEKRYRSLAPALHFVPSGFGVLLSLARLLLYFDVPVAFPLVLALWFLGGFAGGFLIVRVGLFILALDAKDRLLNSVVSFAAGVLIYVVIVNMNDVAAVLAAACLLPITTLLLHFVPTRSVRDEVAVAEESRRLTFDIKGITTGLFCYSFAFGASQGISMTLADEIDSMFFIVLAICLAGIFLVGYTPRMSKVDVFRLPQRMLFPIIAIALLPMPISGTTVRIICCVILDAGFVCYAVINWIVMLQVISLNNLAPIKALGFNRGAGALGIFLGWLLVFAFYQNGSLSETVYAVVSMVGVLLLVIALVFMWWFPQETVVQGDEEKSPYGRWKHRCEEVCEQYALSPREREVFGMLARGRDTEYVQKKLVVSNHTAKTHVHHIYRKLGVHSQQELIDLFESGFQRQNDGE
ncbi:MAG: helix-turn-helix transcriptional regulator [Actinobacteria bacterium]|nr:helix-turn-helix transcriptional regulator [Actinomycetota bacterium]